MHAGQSGTSCKLRRAFNNTNHASAFTQQSRLLSFPHAFFNAYTRGPRSNQENIISFSGDIMPSDMPTRISSFRVNPLHLLLEASDHVVSGSTPRAFFFLFDKNRLDACKYASKLHFVSSLKSKG